MQLMALNTWLLKDNPKGTCCCLDNLRIIYLPYTWKVHGKFRELKGQSTMTKFLVY